MTRGLLAEGRVAEVARMVEPLVDLQTGPPKQADDGEILLRALLARIRLLRFGDVPRVLDLLNPFERLSDREALSPVVRAEVALWLGWAHAWQDDTSFDDARALNLLAEADRLFRDTLSTTGRCWTLIGKAQAYFSIDEYQLMLKALNEASLLEDTINDAQARRWIHDLSVTGARFLGRFAQAQSHLDALKTLAARQNDPMAQGRAHAYQATLYRDLGRDPAVVIEEAVAAANILSHNVVMAGYPLLSAYRAHIQALIRQGALSAAEQLIESALATVGHVPSATSHILTQRAHIALIHGNYDRAKEVLDSVLMRTHRLQHQLLSSDIALVRSDLAACLGEQDRAIDWAERAADIARETGHTGHQLRALLHLATLAANRRQLDELRAALRAMDSFNVYFSILPFAAPRFRILALQALLEHNPEEARAYFAQALSAYSLTGEIYQTAQIQLELARLGRTNDPSGTLPLLESALLVFNQLQAHPELEEARALLDLWPPAAEPAPEILERAIGASLARAAVSVELVAVAWLQAVERLLGERWMSIYQCPEDGDWTRVHEHASPPADLSFPDVSQSRQYKDGILWLRLRSHPGTAFVFGIALPSEDDPAWSIAFVRLTPWLPVLTLALDHALLRTHRLNTARHPDLLKQNEPDPSLPDFVYASTGMREVVHQIHQIRASHSPVLITGESGTGKELIARAVHTTSERKKAAIVAFNCSTVPHELFDSHLFGHEKGAFTGATYAHPGVIRAADRGTLILDEIGDLPLDVQPKLLRFLQEGEIFPLGAKRSVQVNVRIIAATNQDLEQHIRAGRFREDLFYRLNVIPIRVPPLRDRLEEIPLLVRRFLNDLRPQGAPLAIITNQALEALLQYDWPGNIRQLRNELERALVFVSNEPVPIIDVKDLSPALIESAGSSSKKRFSSVQDQILEPGHDLDDILADTEKALIERVLVENNGQVSASAVMLGLTRQGLYKKMKRLGVNAGQFQERAEKPSGDSFYHLN